MTIALDDAYARAVVSGTIINNLRFAVTAESQEDLLMIVDNIVNESSNVGVKAVLYASHLRRVQVKSQVTWLKSRVKSQVFRPKSEVKSQVSIPKSQVKSQVLRYKFQVCLESL